ncbi:MAG: phosphodiester glycosidase family protein, partial [Actinomycetota bacterium]
TDPTGTDGTGVAGPTTTIDSGPVAPAAIKPFVNPALAGEGQWNVIASAGGHPALWATAIRPYPAAGGVVGSVVVIDQTYLRAGMFNGSEEPGGDWVRDDRVPPELYPSLVAAMNGGFRFEHLKGGYVTEGKVVKPLNEGDATLAVRKSDGKLVLGALGREIKDDGSWLSIRQNLVLMVDDGKSQVQAGVDQAVFWGANYGKDVYVNRSAVCELKDGRLAYMIIGKVSADQMADSMINLGCMKAIQLDINGTWPNFFTFEKRADGSVKPIFLDKRMGTNTYRYIRGSTKEFFAFFDATMVPAKSVLDA